MQIYFSHFSFLSVIWFTSKLANNTEIIAFLSSGVSFWRFLRPYLVGATIVCIFALILGMFLAPKASKGFNEFKYEYLKKDIETKETRDVYRQINDNEYIYASHFQPLTNSARNFTLEHFEGNKLQFKISASSLRFNEEDSIYSLTNVDKRIVGVDGDSIIHQNKLDTILPFEFDELTPDAYIAETLNYSELNEFIKTERRRGSGNINRYLVVAYKRWSLPVSAFILTIIAVAVSSMKRRGGMGLTWRWVLPLLLFLYFLIRYLVRWQSSLHSLH